MDKHLKKTSSSGKSKVLTNEIKQAKAFGIVVRRLRQSRKLSQEGLATIAGIDRAHMGKIERGEHMPTLGIVFKIAAALEASAGAILIDVEKELKSSV